MSKAPPPTPSSFSDFFSFRLLISHTLIQIIYVLGLLVLCFTGGVNLVNGSVLGGVGVLVIGNIIWRVLCEWMILFYSIHQRLVAIEHDLR